MTTLCPARPQPAEPVDHLAVDLEVLPDSGSGARAGRRLMRVGVVVAVAAVLAVEAVVIAPQAAGVGAALSQPRWGWLGVALVAEAGSMVYFARVQRRMLAAGGVRLALRRVVAVTLASNAMSVTLPAGSVVGTGYTFRRMRAWGASTPVVTWGILASGVLSTTALTLIGAFGAGLVGGGRDLAVVAVELVAVATLAVLMRALARRPGLLLSIGDRGLRSVNSVLRRPAESGRDRLGEVIADILLIRPRPTDWVAGLSFAALNWLLDLTCLIAACHAVGASGPTIAVAMVAYAGGMAASSLPLLPGGVGVVDGALLLTLTRGGLTLTDATAGVLVYRLISFVLVAAIGWGFWGLLRRGDRRRARRAAAFRLRILGRR